MTGNSQDIIQWLFTQDRETLFEIKEFKQHRTLSQNAYVWKLINEIANKVNKSNYDEAKN